MWRLVRGNVLGFLGKFKDSHICFQITLENQMSRESRFPFNPISVRMWIPFKTCGYLDSQA